MAQFINPFSDWGFKHIFGREISKDLLICFLNDLFAGEFVIKSLAFGNKEQIGLSKDSREVIFDIYCTTDEGKEIIVEMQNRGQEHFIDRALYYTSRVIVNQGIKGTVETEYGKREVWNYLLAPVYTICLLNYGIDELTPTKFRTDVALMDMKEKTIFSNRIRLIYLMLPLFDKKTEAECETDFERWIYILKNMSTFERMPFEARNAVFKKLSEIADISALSVEDRERYDESLKIMLDYNATMEGAALLGKKEGIEEGIKEGRKEGIKESKLDTARLMLANGEDISKIMCYTGLTESEINNLS